MSGLSGGPDAVSFSELGAPEEEKRTSGVTGGGTAAERTCRDPSGAESGQQDNLEASTRWRGKRWQLVRSPRKEESGLRGVT